MKSLSQVGAGIYSIVLSTEAPEALCLYTDTLI